MKTALILMSILGCDDTATQCHYVEMLDQRWATVQDCDASSEEKLKAYANLPYPVVVAVCQTPEDTGLAELASEAPPKVGPPMPPLSPAEAAAAASVPPEVGLPQADIPPPQPPEATAAVEATPDAAEAGLATRVIERFKAALPEKDTLKSLVSEPVHVVTDSYSWVARRFEE
ncbi:hypothetical protein [Hoeflea olei]|uniref:Uncharacterized protein n=1 Tax=Hoeflea olei TaxID=1480615 RepID=A0A1C1YT21_9HYPH|nr:hypothetical protein [Hoeflea olei]OCW56596.1 hypothetical protein AWJ14_16775 [Hoeflea olei]